VLISCCIFTALRFQGWKGVYYHRDSYKKEMMTSGKSEEKSNKERSQEEKEEIIV